MQCITRLNLYQSEVPFPSHSIRRFGVPRISVLDIDISSNFRRLNANLIQFSRLKCQVSISPFLTEWGASLDIVDPISFPLSAIHIPVSIQPIQEPPLDQIFVSCRSSPKIKKCQVSKKIIPAWMLQGWGSGKQMLEPGKQD